MANALCQGKDSNGKVAPMGATKTASGEPAGLMVAEVSADFRGNYSATWYLEAVNAAGAADNDVLYTSSDVSMYNYHVIQNNDTMNIDVHVSVDGNVFVGPVALQTTAVTAPGTTLVTVIAAGEAGIFRGKVKEIRVDQAAAGTCEAGNVLIAHGVE